MCEWECCSNVLLLENGSSYQPDTLDLNADAGAAAYWFPLLRNMISKFSKQAAASQNEEDSTADNRAQQFLSSYNKKLDDYELKANNNNKIITLNENVEGNGKENSKETDIQQQQQQQPAQHQQCIADNNSSIDNDTKVLGLRKLLELNELELRKFGFGDPWLKQKTQENAAALKLFEERLNEIDGIQDEKQKWTELIRGVLAGNMFDWGAQAVANILLENQNFGLHSALERIQKRPWLMDDLDKWLDRVVPSSRQKNPHKCAVIFVDNSGVDITLGILPFVRELLKQGTKIILCANPEPTLNDVTFTELTTIVKNCSSHCPIFNNALTTNNLLIYQNGQIGPCLDMRTLPKELCEAIKTNETDLLVIEGMGRALHTNLYAKFNCETLKLAVIKNQWLANRLGGDTFSVICRYEKNLNSAISNSNNTSNCHHQLPATS